MGSGRVWLAGDWPSTGAFSTLLRQSGLRASNGGVLATKSEHLMLASTCLIIIIINIIIIIIIIIQMLTEVQGHKRKITRRVAVIR